MALFPTSPVNGDQTTVNGITYVYASSTKSWTRVPSGVWQVGNGNSTLSFATNGGNANISIGGTSNVAVFATTGEYVTGLVSATGNITSAANISGTYLLGNVFYATGILTSKIYNGTTEANIGTSGGNANISVGGTSNVVVVYSGGVSVTGDLTVTGNATLSGNILGDRIVNGTTELDIQTAGGNANLTVGGTSNVVVWATTGEYVTGLISASGNIISASNIAGGNILATSNVNAVGGYFTGNVTVLGNLNASIGIVYANSGIFYGNTVTGNSAIYGGLPTFTPLGSNVVAQFASNANSYSQINFQNISNLTSASTDYIATADNGTDTSYYVDVGINSSNFNDQTNYPGFGPNDSYVHNHGGNLILNPETSGKVIKFMVGGTGNAQVVANVTSTGITSGGTFSAAGNITSAGNVSGTYLLGNVFYATGISASKIYNGTSEANIGTSGGNANISIGGTSNVVVFATTGEYVTGVVSASGNITAGNIVTGGLITATGNVTAGNLITSGSGGSISGTGNILTSGLLSVTGNITTANKLFVGLSSTTLTNPVAVFSGSGASYDQVALFNSTGTGSSDYVTYGNNGDDNQSWMDMGFTGNTFNDSNYTITAAGDGYIFAQGNTSFGGNLVIATGNTGTTRDIVFSFGFLTASEFVRFQKSTNTILPYANATANIGSTTKYLNNLYAVSHIGTVVSTTGNITSASNVIGGNLLTSGLVSATGNVTSAGNVSGTYLLGNVFYATGISASKIYNGTSEANIGTSGGNANITIGGTSNVVVVYSGGVSVTGDLTVTGNATLSGNILGDRIVNGTTELDIQTAGGNANLTVGGTSNVVVWATTGEYVTGLISASGNITSAGNISGGNILGNGQNLTGINSFSTISVSGQSDVVADSITDTLTFAAGTGIAITTDAANDTITIAYASSTSIFATGGSMGTVTEAVTQSQDLGNVADATSGTSYDLGQIAVDGVVLYTNIPLYELPGNRLANDLVYTSNLSVTGNIVESSGNIYISNVIVPNQDQVVAYIFAF